MPSEAPFRISVVTIALNAARDLPLTIESVIAQDYPDLQHLVVDGGSWDESAAILARYRPYVDRVIVREDAGIYPAMNDALDEVDGDYVIFLNAGDQFFSADAVSRIVGGVTGRPGIFYGDHIYVDRRLELLKRAASFDWLAERLRSGSIDAAWHSAIPGHQATFTALPVLRRLRYDTRLRVAADHDLLFRAHAAGIEMRYVDEIVAHYHGGGFSVTAGELTRTEGVSVYRRFSDDPVGVDRYFYPEGSPFAAQTARTGFPLTGFLSAVDAPGGERAMPWLSPGGATLMASDASSRGLALSGINRLEGQGLDVVDGRRLVARVALPVASFRIELPFEEEVAPSSIVSLRLWLGAEDGESSAASVAIRAFRFLTHGAARSHRLLPGETLSFRRSAALALGDVLGSGWAAAEEGHLWSVGGESDLWLGLDEAVRRVTFDLGGNPHVEGQRQEVALLVNGVAVEPITLAHGERRTIGFDADAAPWQPGAINHLRFQPDRFAAPPAETGDARLLGLCLWSVAVA